MHERNMRQRPPRHLPAFTRLSILLGGIFVQLGFLFFGIGGSIFSGMLSISYARYWLSDHGEPVPAQGNLLRVERTSTRVNKEYLYAYCFEYKVEDKTFENCSYDYWRDDLQQQGQPVRIMYRSKKPERAYIVGMEEMQMPGWAMLLLGILPGTGLFFIAFGLARNRRSLWLIVNGVFTRGKLVDKRATNMQINRQPVYAYAFEFEVERQGTITARCSTHQTQRVEDESQEIILYDPRNPHRNAVYDAIPVAPVINRRGEFEPVESWRIALLVFPLVMLSLVVLVTWLLW